MVVGGVCRSQKGLKPVPNELRRFAKRTCAQFVSSSVVAMVDYNRVLLGHALSGQITAVLKGHQARVTSVSVSAWSALELVSCDEQGLVCVWDLKNSQLLASFEDTHCERVCGSFAVINSASGKKSSKVAKEQSGKRKRSWPSTSDWKVCRVDVSSGSRFKVAKDDVIFQASSENETDSACCVRDLVVGPPNSDNQGMMACMTGRKVLLYDSTTGHKNTLVLRSTVSSVAIHPREKIVVVGDSAGHIMVFRANGDDFESYEVTQLHWHRFPVDALAFSIDGSSFVSGGEEMVLVSWQLESGEKSFLPRLGEQIRQVAASPDGARFLIALKNGSFRVFDLRSRQLGPEFNTVSSTSQLANKAAGSGRALKNHRPPALKDIPEGVHKSYGVVVEPRSGCCVVQVTPGVLNFVDLACNNRIVTTVDVTSTNSVMSISRDQKVKSAYVESVAFASRDQNHMVTLERRGRNRALKFWFLDRSQAKRVISRDRLENSRKRGGESALSRATPASSGNTHGDYIVTTHVDQPHKETITAVLMSELGDLVITASKDSSFKVWQRELDSGRWTCRSVGYYRNQPILAAALSKDGSLLAIANGCIVTLWDVRANGMLATLTQPSAAQEDYVRHLCFYGNVFLAVATRKGHLVVWNVVERKLLWQMRFSSPEQDRAPIRALSPHSHGKLMVALLNGRVLVFGAGPIPDHFLQPDRPPSNPITGVACISGSNHVVFACGFEAAELLQEVEQDEAPVKLEESTVSPNWDVIQAAFQSKSASALELEQDMHKSHHQLQMASSSISAMKALDDFPSHVLPPLSKLVDVFVSSSTSSSSSSSGAKTEEEPRETKRFAPSSFANQENSSDMKKSKRAKLALNQTGASIAHSDSTIPDNSGDEDTLVASATIIGDTMPRFFKRILKA